MVRMTIEPFLKNTLEFTDLRTTGARWRGRGYFWTSRYNQKCNLAFGRIKVTPHRTFSSKSFRIHRLADDWRALARSAEDSDVKI